MKKLQFNIDDTFYHALDSQKQNVLQGKIQMLLDTMASQFIKGQHDAQGLEKGGVCWCYNGSCECDPPHSCRCDW